MDEFNLHCDNAMQWNFWWFVLNKTLWNIIKVGIITFCDIKFNLWIKHLFLEDWNNLADMHKFLKLFYNITIIIQSVFNAIDKIFPTMNYLFTHFKNKCYDCVCRSFMATQINTAWNKFVQYYAIINNVVIYFFAITFNFIYKWNYFDKH